MVAVVDYGVGNLFSLQSSLKAIGADSVITGDKAVLERAERIILPGVGAFRDAKDKLCATGLDRVVCESAKSGKPLLGICLGMQLLLEKSYEYGEYDGLSLIGGNVRPIADYVPNTYKIPHIGWNALSFIGEKSPIFKYTAEGDCVYFVHSYFACECEAVTAVAEYGVPIAASVGRDNIYGCQFHPEKSGEVGLNILKAFCEV